ncbi:ectoine hydroxylase [Emcibacter sp.]|uniref:ectoine hydroxylase n=1 Tax=Emcibacter sp. TaxID=1979954 RepID=UPI002AA81CE2|nr:ectoine hydroxylase [Emcibacter sp.]
MLSDLYPSRKGTEPQILLRHDPVVYTDLQDGLVLTREQKEDFDRNGFLVLTNFFSDIEIRLLQRELEDLRLKSENIRQHREVISEPQSGDIRSIFRIHKNSRVFEKLSRDARLVNVARDILADDVYIHQSRLNYKPGFEGREFYWHSDFETWHVEDGLPNMRAISISVTLTENTPQNGALMMIPSSHRDFISCVGETPEEHYKESLKKQEYGVPDHHSLEYLANKGGIEQVTGPAGTVVIFDSNIMHGSNGNITPYSRSNAFFVYNSVQNRIRAPFGSLSPRPEFIAARKEIEIVMPEENALLSSSAQNWQQASRRTAG